MLFGPVGLLFLCAKLDTFSPSHCLGGPGVGGCYSDGRTGPTWSIFALFLRNTDGMDVPYANFFEFVTLFILYP